MVTDLVHGGGEYSRASFSHKVGEGLRVRVMSVILNALQSQEKDKENATKDSSGEGLFVGGSGFEVKISQKPPRLPRRLWILLGVLCVALAFTITSFVLKNPFGVEEPASLNLPPLRNTLYKKPVKLNDTQNRSDSIPQNAADLFYEGNFDESLKEYQNALTLDPDNAELHNNTGLVLLKKGLFDSAEKHFNQAIELDAACAMCFNNLGYLKTLTGQHDVAKRHFKKAIELKPDYVETYFNLAVLHEKNGDVAEAVTAYQDFLKYLPNKDTELAEKVKDRMHELTGGHL